MDKRVSTGIKGLDKLIEGGIPQGSVVLLSGAPGTGKSIMSMQFLEAGLKKGENCVYVTIEELPEKIIHQGEQFGLFKKAPKMISAKDIKYDVGARKPDNIQDIIKLILEKLKAIKPDRLVIDSISSLSIEDGLVARKVSKTLVEGLNKLALTTLVTGEALESSYPDAVTPFLVDGVVVLNTLEIGPEVRRVLSIVKMRDTKVDLSKKAFDIKSNGIELLKDTDIFGERI